MTEFHAPELRHVGAGEIASCFALMRQLRPHLATAEEFAVRWVRQHEQGYRLVALWGEARPLALAGYRVTENLIHGRFLYVDDLVVEADRRGDGFGARLIAWLTSEARRSGCAKLVLDTGLDNALAHRFYFRQGLLAKALRFNLLLD